MAQSADCANCPTWEALTGMFFMNRIDGLTADAVARWRED
jgi:hypothetical protein